MDEIGLDQLSAERFAEFVRTKFQVLLQPEIVVSLELIDVSTPTKSQSYERFSLLFNGPLDQPLDQRTYRFEHEQLGSFDLFIVPVGADHEARQYEVVFNRRILPHASR